jgi:hypothetical protein
MSSPQKNINEIKYKTFGGAIDSDTLQKMISNGYQDDPKKVNSIDNYKIDKSLSGQRVQVYHNKDTGHLVINHRGTKGIHDVVSDIGLMFNNKSNDRFAHGKKITDQALQKYDTDNVTITGHSLGHQIAKESNKNNHELITVNPAITPYDMFNKQKKNETIVRSSLDPISALHSLNPFASKNNTINIKAKSYNPLTEHSSNVLDRIKGTTLGR